MLDKLVPGYYQRRDEDGTLCQSTCCNNVATEHYMAERLSVEDLVHWAKHYKVCVCVCVCVCIQRLCWVNVNYEHYMAERLSVEDALGQASQGVEVCACVWKCV